MSILSEKEINLTIFASRRSGSQFLKERICSSRSKFLPLRVDLMSESYLILRSKQDFMQLNKILSSKKWQGAFVRAWAFIRMNEHVINPICTQKGQNSECKKVNLYIPSVP